MVKLSDGHILLFKYLLRNQLVDTSYICFVNSSQIRLVLIENNMSMCKIISIVQLGMSYGLFDSTYIVYFI